jgi:hypothetical protein
MDIDYSNESSSDGSGSSESSYSEDMNVERDVNMIQPYAFEPNGFWIFVKFWQNHQTYGHELVIIY